MRKGHKQNSFLNGGWGVHMKKAWKRITSKKRRMKDKTLILKEKKEI
jgi:hypothetical protein